MVKKYKNPKWKTGLSRRKYANKSRIVRGKKEELTTSKEEEYGKKIN